MENKIELNDKGYIVGLDGKARVEHLFFPSNDLLSILLTASLAAEVRGKKEGVMETDISPITLALPTGLYTLLIEEIERIESDMLESGMFDCTSCRNEHSEQAPNRPKCAGVLKKGDLLHNVVGAMLKVGVESALQTVIQELSDRKQMERESSAVEFFGPLLRGILEEHR